MIDGQRRFLEKEFYRLTLQGVVQRAQIYLPNLSEKRRSRFQRALHDHLFRLEPSYRNPVTDDEHIKRISQMADELSGGCRDLLTCGRFRIGSAQKALNLFLKYWWCIGWIPTPPHCPFDAQIIAILPAADVPANARNWTELDDISSYRTLVELAKREAARHSLSLAEWELDRFNKLNQRSA